MKAIFNKYIHSSLTYGDIANKGTIRNKMQNQHLLEHPFSSKLDTLIDLYLN